MTVRDTSRHAYHEHRDSGRLGTQQRAVLEFLQAHPDRSYTRAELARDSGITLSAICGRVNELVSAGRVVEPYRRHCEITGKRVWALRAAPEQMEIAA